MIHATDWPATVVVVHESAGAAGVVWEPPARGGEIDGAHESR